MLGSLGKTVLAIAILLVVVAMAFWRLGAPLLERGECDLSRGPCSAWLGEQRIEIELTPARPRPEEEMLLSVRLVGDLKLDALDGKRTVEFSMPGMDMGEHGMPLATSGPDLLEGRISLPSCPMGHSLWKASIRIAGYPPAEVDLHVGE